MGDKKKVEVRTLREGGFILIDDEPCKIIKIQTSSPGKHGAAKAKMEAFGVYDDKRRTIVKPTSDKVFVPIIDKKSGLVNAVMGEKLQLMDMETYETFEIPLPSEFSAEQLEGKEVEYHETMGRIKIARIKG